MHPPGPFGVSDAPGRVLGGLADEAWMREGNQPEILTVYLQGAFAAISVVVSEFELNSSNMVGDAAHCIERLLAKCDD